MSTPLPRFSPSEPPPGGPLPPQKSTLLYVSSCGAFAYDPADVLNEGGEGTVYRAGSLAVKVLFPGFSLGPLESIPSHHPVLLKPLAITSFDGLQAGIYPLARCDLFGIIETHLDGLPNALVVVILRDLVSGFIVLHAAGVAMRDLKLENVLVMPAYWPSRVAISDFGASCPAFQDLQKDLLQGIYGCPADDAHRPSGVFEQTFDLRSLDVYALGMLAIVLVCGYTAAADYAVSSVLPAGCDPLLASFVTAACSPVAADRPTMAELMLHPFISQPIDGLAADPLAPYIPAP